LSEFSTYERTVNEWLEEEDLQQSPARADQSDGCTEKKKQRQLVWFHVASPVRIEQPKIGVCASGRFDDLDASLYVKTVKAAQTAFAVVKYCPDDDSTIVLVRPATGRTHQIRIHLQHLGHSIANDPNYGGSMWFGNPEGERACCRAQLILDACNTGHRDQSLSVADAPATEDEVLTAIEQSRAPDESLEAFVERTCVWCARTRGMKVEERASLEFLVRSPGLWLHALQYTVNSTSFRTDLPSWSLSR
jgi:hypothetical protein